MIIVLNERKTQQPAYCMVPFFCELLQWEELIFSDGKLTGVGQLEWSHRELSRIIQMLCLLIKVMIP